MNPANAVEVIERSGAQHAFDRLMVPIVVSDPFGDEGSRFTACIMPQVTLASDVAQEHAARKRLVPLFQRNL